MAVRAAWRGWGVCGWFSLNLVLSYSLPSEPWGSCLCPLGLGLQMHMNTHGFYMGAGCLNSVLMLAFPLLQLTMTVASKDTYTWRQIYF